MILEKIPSTLYLQNLKKILTQMDCMMRQCQVGLKHGYTAIDLTCKIELNMLCCNIMWLYKGM